VVRKVPVYVAYFTAWRDAEGKVGFYDDVYGRDEHLRKAMDLTTSSRQSGS
jgi:murein L,D-transpeptidase YcbB/YkuD